LNFDGAVPQLGESAELLETICDQTLAMMNEGATLDDVLHGVVVPEALLERPYLRPVYDHPLFIVRNLVKRQGGRVVARSEGSGAGSRFVVTLRAEPQAGSELEMRA